MKRHLATVAIVLGVGFFVSAVARNPFAGLAAMLVVGGYLYLRPR